MNAHVWARHPHSLWTRGWFWMALLGVGMLVSGLVAVAIAITTVVLPYDEWFVGLSRFSIQALNPRLLPFMAHDRLTVAGTIISLAVLYVALAYNALRAGAAWAQRVILVSASIGFSGFFLWIAFGYLDPVHALTTLILFGFFLLGLHGYSH